MILISSNTTNNISLYNKFKVYIDKYLTNASNEEFIRNYSYDHISVLKLYCAFNLVEYIYKLSLLTNIDTSLQYTIDELISKYNILEVNAEFQKNNIELNDVWSIFFGTTIPNNLYAFKNKYHSVTRLNKI